MAKGSKSTGAGARALGRPHSVRKASAASKVQRPVPASPKTTPPTKKTTAADNSNTTPSAMKVGTNDDMSECTTAAANTNSAIVISTYVSFLSFRFKVDKTDNKGSETMRKQICKLFKLLQHADDSLTFSHYKLDASPDNNTGTFSTPQSTTLDDPDNLPTSITAMGKFFFGARPYNKGGTIWSQVRVLHSKEIENIIADTREDMKENDAHLILQTIQHWDVASLGFFKHLHPDVDITNFAEYLSKQLAILQPSPVLQIGLQVKTPYDGKKRVNTTTSHYRDRIQAVHVGAVGIQAKTTNRLLKVILASSEFKHRYVCDVRLVPFYDRNSSPYIQDKIRRCIVQHGQFCKCVVSNTCDGIDFLDQTNRPLKKTLRQLILGIPDSHFINIDLNWSRSSYAILYPQKYEEMARDKIANLGAYLHKTYGDNVLQSLPADTQELIKEVTWDQSTGRPLSKLDRELDEILEIGDTLDYVDITHLSTPTERPHNSGSFGHIYPTT